MLNRVAWLVPIRYWETADYQPVRVNLLHRVGKRDWYAFHHDYGHDCYIPRNRVFYSWFAARRAQHSRAARKSIMAHADFAVFWNAMVREFLS